MQALNPTPVAAQPAQGTVAATVRVPTASRSYDIVIGSGLLVADTFAGLPRASQALIVSNPTVHALHGAALHAAVAAHHRQVHTVLLPDGEQHKDMATLGRVFDHLLQ